MDILDEALPPKPRAIRYPWREWFGRKRLTLRHGIDFHCLPHGIRQTAKQAARRMGLKIRATIRHDSLEIEVLDATDRGHPILRRKD